MKVWGKEGERGFFFSHWVEVDALIIFLSDIHLGMWAKFSSRSFMNSVFFLLIAHQTSVNKWGVMITFPLSSVLDEKREKREKCLQSSAESLLQSEQTEKMLLIAHMAQSCLPSSLFLQLSHTVRVWRKSGGGGMNTALFIMIIVLLVFTTMLSLQKIKTRIIRKGKQRRRR